MKRTYHKHKNNKIVGALASYAITLSLLMVLHWSYLFFMPITHWYNWTTTETVKSNYPVDANEIDVYSYTTIKRPSDVTFIDVLFCDYGDDKGLRHISAQVDKGIKLTKNKPGAHILQKGDPYYGQAEIRYIWTYVNPLPKQPASCYIETESQLHLDYGITKSQYWKTGYFSIK
jgi:hypothetical protein